MNDLDVAMQLVLKKHEGQTDKQGKPYWLHCSRVMHAVPERLMIPALLHDIIEDTDITHDDLQVIFGSHVADLVQCLTHIPGEPRGLYIDRIIKDPDAIIIKMADITDNYKRIGGLEDHATRKRLKNKYDDDFAKLVKAQNLLGMPVQ